jgi:hypothetical protein
VDPDLPETGQPYAFTGDDPLNESDPLGLYAYSYYWKLGSKKKLGSAQKVSKYFASHAKKVFPFSTGNCSALKSGEACDFHPLGTTDKLSVSKINSTSVTLTVSNWCQVGGAGACAAGDPAGSTVSFSVGYEGSGQNEGVYLEQNADAPGAGPLTDYAVDNLDLALYTWHQQASNLSSAVGGTGNAPLIEGPGWSTAQSPNPF